MPTGSVMARHPARARDDKSGPSRLESRWLTVVLGVVVGLLALGVSVLSALVSRFAWRPGPVTVPWGLVLAVAASLSVVLIARAFSRGMAFVAAAGWILGTGIVLSGRPEGDYVFAQDALGIGYLLVGTVAVISAAAAGGPRR